MAKTAANKLKYIKEYDKSKRVQIVLKLNKDTDSDVIEILNQVKNKQGFIKALIRLNSDNLDEYGVFEEYAKYSEEVRYHAKEKGIDPEDVRTCILIGDNSVCNVTTDCSKCIRTRVMKAVDKVENRSKKS